ncbi:MAG: tRNA (N(6)-L-threonylcarbamoyladenosine(37)-C(2))-methylthiotransferase MtaB [Planctomycetes bacterium RBG_13_62_9]|nr:MAG: tRNA (N(6)-L-threonylcarbamoyladenosine(37)-C(2))-methylthiotransferase MtaB [Planctomycetes bacterium RBG_13_62_9]
MGCKVNQYETQQIRQLLEGYGLAQVAVTERPELVVINTCCVTHTASAKSRHFIHQAQKHRPEAVVICGCLPTVHTDELKAAGENVHVVKDRRDLAATLHLLAAAQATTPDAQSSRHFDTPIKSDSDAKVKSKKDLCPPGELPLLTSFAGQTRAFLKVQDGCDCHCSYCIIPTARPDVRFKIEDEILAEAAALVAAGHKEIVLTGVHIGAYGYDTARRRDWPDKENPHLPNLLDKVAQVPNLARIRLSSLDPTDVTPRLLDVFASHPNIMPHLHLSLQSGSTAVLRRMNRPYTADDFRDKVALIQSRLDRPAITTDIIVGFPTETDAEFAETLALAREVTFAKMHVFAFSARQGTPAAQMHPKVPPQIKKHRSQILRDLDSALQSQYRTQFIGETAQVLIEGADPVPTGRAERYFEVQIPNAPQPLAANDLVAVKMEKDAPDGVRAALIS